MNHPYPNSRARRMLAVFAGIIIAILLSPINPVKGQTTQPRTVKDISADLQADTQKMHEILGSFEVALDPATRGQTAPKIIPVLYRISADLDEWGNAQPEAKDEIIGAQMQFVMLRALFGDKPSIDRLQQLADDKDPQQSLQGKSAQLMIQWFEANKDSAAQSKVADQFESLAKAHPESDELTRQLLMMTELGAATPALSTRLADLVLNVMKSPEATAAQHQILASRQMKAMENKPLVISGTTPDGKPFSTADWKGKVIFVDFWATWCGPCVAELPRVKKAYADFHGKGLEVLGVSNDYAATDLTQFLTQNKDMPWTQLFDAAAAAQQNWNPITLGFGIDRIPTMFLIDKKGILRSTDAEQDFQEQIPKLLAE